MILSSHDKSLSNNFAINFRPSRSPVAKIIFDIIAILYGNFQNHKNSSENVFWSSKHICLRGEIIISKMFIEAILRILKA